MKLNRKVLFVGDGGNPQILQGILSNCQINLYAHVRPASVKLFPVFRHLRYFCLAAYAVFHRRHYDAVFIWQQYVGLYYFLLSLAYPFHRRPCLVYYIIFKPKQRSLFAWIKRLLLIGMTRSRHVEKVIILSRTDALYKDISEKKRILLSTYTEHSAYIEKRIAAKSVSLDSDYFSGGVSNRDYTALKWLAERMEHKQFSVACLPKDLARISPVPPNMRIDCNAYGEAFEELILSARAVVLPVVDPDVTSGQIVCLRAMQSAKPIFMTRNSFMEGWMKDVADLRFFVMYDDLEDLCSLLSSLTDGDLEELGCQAREYYLNHFDEASFYRGLAEIIESECHC
jgi:hypothetical protein